MITFGAKDFNGKNIRRYKLERRLRKKFCNNKRHLELLENGPHSLSQAWLLGALHNEWKRIKGYEDPDTENKGQCQSSLKEFYSRYKDQGI